MNRVKWIILLLFLGLVAFGLVTLEDRQKSRKGPPIPTTYSAGQGGYKALYMWLKALEVPVQRWERKLEGLPSDARVLLIVRPTFPLLEAEKRSLKQWVRDGGRLVLMVKASWPFLRSFDLAPERKASEEGERMIAAQPGPYTRGVGSVLPWHGAGLRPCSPKAVVHARDSGKGLLAVVKEGGGSVIAFAAPELFSNKGLREGDHARLVLNLLLAHLEDGSLLVDEYHHGYGRASSVFQYLTHSRASGLLLQAGFLFLVVWIAFGSRFGTKRPITPVERRSSLEYVNAVASLMQRAEARALALKSMVKWVEEEARQDLLHTDRGVQSALRQARKSAGAGEPTDRELIATVRRMYGALNRARNRAM